MAGAAAGLKKAERAQYTTAFTLESSIAKEPMLAAGIDDDLLIFLAHAP